MQGLRYLRATLAQERFLDQATAKVQELERDIAIRQAELKRVQDQELGQEREQEASVAVGTRRRGWFW